jgi:DNA-binding MarR family transcriptional regulator
MHGKGLVQTTVNPKSRRDRITIPTVKGLRICDEAVKILNTYHTPIYGKLNEKQRANLLNTLQLLHRQSCRTGRIGSCDHPYEA